MPEGLDIFGDFGLVGGDNTTANPFQDRQTCINWYPEISPSKTSKTATSLLGTPGLNFLIAAGSFTGNVLGSTWPMPYVGPNLPVRGFCVLPGAAPGSIAALAIILNTAYLVQVLTQGTSKTPGTVSLTQVGTLIPSSTGPISARHNGLGGYACVVDGPHGYLYNISTRAFTLITDPNWRGANTISFIDGWWIFNVPYSQTFYTNASPYSTKFDGSLFANKDAAPDRLIGLIESKEELWLIGEQTTEIWYNAGGTYFPFQRLVGTMLHVGCKSWASIARFSSEMQDGLAWFGRSDRGENIVIKTRGFSYEVISTPAVSDAIAAYSVTSDAQGYTYQEDGHEFYVLTFPTADVTWVYDGTMPPDLAWHQRPSYDPYAQALHRHRSNCYMNLGGMRIVGDYQTGALYQMSRSAYTDVGWPILSRRRAPYIWDKGKRGRVFMGSLQIDFAPGQGTPSGLGSNPVANIRISRDNGASFGQQYPANMGGIGQTTNRTIWRRLGFGRTNQVELEVIQPCNRDITGATLKDFAAP